jgi:hypothetical protein
MNGEISIDINSEGNWVGSMEYTVDTNEGIWRVTFFGTMTYQDLLELEEQVKKIHESNFVDLNGLVDLREVSNIHLDFVALSGFTAALRNRSLPNKVRVAIIAMGPIQYGYARMFQTLLNHPQIEVEVFINEKDALDWFSNKAK